MNIELITVGKTDLSEVKSLTTMYAARIGHYVNFALTELPDAKNTRNLSEAEQKTVEGEAIMKRIVAGDFVVLMDERGREYRSVEFAEWLSKRMSSGVKRLVFVIGGAYGFSKSLYDRADGLISLSQMTFSHQIVRAIFAEQLYRALTILNNEPYHHE